MDAIIENSWLILCGGILIWAVYNWKDFAESVKKNPFGDYEEPRLAATLGVLGTFFGISLGLANFDAAPNAMQQSVVNLLGGMKTAFATSILGMAISIGFKYFQTTAQKNFPQSEVNSDATVADLIGYLKKSDAEKFAALTKLTGALAGDGEYTLVGQLKTIRLEMRDNNDKILREFRDFSKTLAENNTKAFIAALNETMRDFNQKLTEQFGENFKQLNVAVGRLLEWQINYKSTLETVTQNLEMTFAGIDAAKNSLAQIENSSAAIQKAAAQIQNLIVTANFYEQQLEQVLAEVANLGDCAKNSIPQIISLVETSCSEIKKSTTSAAANVDALSQQIFSETNLAKNSIVSLVEKSVASAALNVEELSDKIHVATVQAQVNVSKLVEYSCGEIEKATATAANNFNDLSDEIHIAITHSQEFSEQIYNLASESIADFENFSSQTVQSMLEVSRRIETTSYKQREIMDAEIQATKDAVQKAAATLGNDAFKITQNISDSLHNLMKTNNENLQNSTENLNKNLEKVLTASLESFGDTMYKVSEKFVADYTPLTEKLAALIRISQGVERRSAR